jgi:hypothetical protein
MISATQLLLWSVLFRASVARIAVAEKATAP